MVLQPPSQTRTESLFPVTRHSRSAAGNRPTPSSARPVLPGDDRATLLAQPLDAEAHLVSRLQEDGRLLTRADPRRRAGDDDIAGRQRHEAAEIADAVGDAEHHLVGGDGLPALAVHVEAQPQLLRVRDRVAGRPHRPPWTTVGTRPM